MAKQTLPVDFQDDLLNVSMGEKRRYRMINNSDGTVSLEDVTVYDRIGSNFGAGQINATNQAVNESFDKNKLIRDLDTINALTEEGYAVDALSVKQITESLNSLVKKLTVSGTTNSSGAIAIELLAENVIPISILEYDSALRGLYCVNSSGKIVVSFVSATSGGQINTVSNKSVTFDLYYIEK